MNFEKLIRPLTILLTSNAFSVTDKSRHSIDYSSDFMIIRVAYAELEHLYYTYIGQDEKSLIELTPVAIKEVFDDNSFQFQSTLTIDDLTSFLNNSGHSILSGDKTKLEKLAEFSERQSKVYTKQIVHKQNIQMADTAWTQKNYADFISYIDKTEKSLLSQSYLKKYSIALDKLHKRAE